MADILICCTEKNI